jgi:hypothetical protein
MEPHRPPAASASPTSTRPSPPPELERELTVPPSHPPAAVVGCLLLFPRCSSHPLHIRFCSALLPNNAELTWRQGRIRGERRAKPINHHDSKIHSTAPRLSIAVEKEWDGDAQELDAAPAVPRPRQDPRRCSRTSRAWSPASGTIGRKPSYSDTSVPEAQLQMLNNWCAVLSFS